MSFQNIANQTTAQIAGAITAGKFVGQQKESLEKQQEGLEAQKRVEQLQKAQLTLSGYQQGLKEQQALGEEYKEAQEANNKAFSDKIHADNVLEVAKQDRDIIESKYNKEAQEALASGKQSKIWSLAGQKMRELTTKYDPYVRAQQAAEKAYNESNLRFKQVGEQNEIMKKRMEILREQKEAAYKTIDELYKGGKK